MDVFHYKSAVIKVGTGIVRPKDAIKNLVDQIVLIGEEVERIYLVTSGAMAFGRAKHGVKKRQDESDARKRMFSACGQVDLMSRYEEYVEGVHKWIAYQILVTRKNFSSMQECAELLGTLDEIFNAETKGLPIINENDAIADDEIRGRNNRFTDNDELAGMLANLVRADVMVLLTNTNGVQRNLKKRRSNIPEISIEEQEKNRKFVISNATNGDEDGTGGMESKYNVCCKTSQNGIRSIIADGRKPDTLKKIFLTGGSSGTAFLPH